jgi:hypothetical protein
LLSRLVCRYPGKYFGQTTRLPINLAILRELDPCILRRTQQSRSVRCLSTERNRRLQISKQFFHFRDVPIDLAGNPCKVLRTR